MRVPGYEFTIRYRGKSVGTLKVAVCRWTGMSRLPTTDSLTDVAAFCVLGFEPAADYVAIQPLVRRAGAAFERLGFVGAVGDGVAWDAGWAAEAVAQVLWAELEVLGAAGYRVPWRVGSFYELAPRGERHFRVELSREDAGPAVPAVLRSPQPDDAGVRPPAP